MIRYRYNEQCTPPAPFAYVTLRSVDTGEEYGESPAQLDTAADRSVIPWKVVEALGLTPVEEIPIAGLGGHVSSLPAFFIQIQPRLLDPVEVKVVSTSDEPFVLLGRDVLNQYRLFLYGPELVFDIG